MWLLLLIAVVKRCAERCALQLYRTSLMAVVCPEYEFLFVDVGMNGRDSDGGNWSGRLMKEALEENSLDLPKATPLLGRNIDMPYVLVGDNAFPLTTTLVKPFPPKRVFNYRS